MSQISYAAGSRFLTLMGGVAMSFYDWYCDLPPASPETWGEQTDVSESADWYNSRFMPSWLEHQYDPHRPTRTSCGGTPRGGQADRLRPDFSQAQVCGLLIPVQFARHALLDGRQPCHPQGELRRPAGPVLHGLRHGIPTALPRGDSGVSDTVQRAARLRGVRPGQYLPTGWLHTRQENGDWKLPFLMRVGRPRAAARRLPLADRGGHWNLQMEDGVSARMAPAVLLDRPTRSSSVDDFTGTPRSAGGAGGGCDGMGHNLYHRL